MAGTIYYQAPETVGKHGWTFAVDMWAVWRKLFNGHSKDKI